MQSLSGRLLVPSSSGGPLALRSGHLLSTRSLVLLALSCRNGLQGRQVELCCVRSCNLLCRRRRLLLGVPCWLFLPCDNAAAASMPSGNTLCCKSYFMLCLSLRHLCPDPRVDSPLPCPAGYFSPSSGSTSCTVCPPGFSCL